MEEQPQAPAPAEPTATPVAEPQSKMSKKQIIGITVLSLIAIASVAFGIYGMFFHSNNDGKTNNNEISSEVSPTGKEATEKEQSSSVSVDKAASILEEKFDFKPQMVVMFDGWHDYIKNLDQANKLVFLVYKIEDKLGPKQYDENLHQTIRNISFNDMNSAYEYYFGNSDPLEKNDFEMEGVVRKIDYNEETDSFDIYTLDGIGGYSTTVMLSKIAKTYDTENGFKAIIPSVTINTEISQDKKELLGSRSDGTNDYYTIQLKDDEIEKIRESLKVYEFHFTKTNDDYVLESIKEIN